MQKNIKKQARKNLIVKLATIILVWEVLTVFNITFSQNISLSGIGTIGGGSPLLFIT
jgi:hypothetical protein